MKLLIKAGNYVELGMERGVTIAETRRSRGYDDFDILRNLEREGFMIRKPIGPHGGLQFVTTEKGIEEFKKQSEQKTKI